MYIRTSEYSRDVFYNNFFYQNASNITIYDDNRFSITLPFAKPLLPFYCTLFIPSPPHFYCEFGPSYVERYQWRVPPTTGAYVVKPGRHHPRPPGNAPARAGLVGQGQEIHEVHV